MFAGFVPIFVKGSASSYVVANNRHEVAVTVKNLGKLLNSGHTPVILLAIDYSRGIDSSGTAGAIGDFSKGRVRTGFEAQGKFPNGTVSDILYIYVLTYKPVSVIFLVPELNRALD